MNDLDSVRPSVEILRDAGVPFALTHCTSMYPTPYDKVRLGALADLRRRVSRRGPRPERSFARQLHLPRRGRARRAHSRKALHLRQDLAGSGRADLDGSRRSSPIWSAARARSSKRSAAAKRSCRKSSRRSTSPTRASSRSAQVKEGEAFSAANVWVKRPGTGEIKARDFDRVLGGRARTRATQVAGRHQASLGSSLGRVDRSAGSASVERPALH